MKEFLLKWNYKKHLLAEALFYGSIATLGNALFFKKGKIKKVVHRKSKNPGALLRSMPKKQKTFNLCLLSVFAADLTASYFLLKHIQKKLG